ncbi:MAG: Iron-sulfur cluster biosynthesis [Nocardioides sp.]|nr:Iron-sulfur cluster biosynthesis [Nocardioides sp.]
MLTLTENASTIIHDITTQPGLADTAGLRISAEAEAAEPTFAVSAAQAPEPGDQTLEQDGATIYLDQDAAVMLDDKVLDAAVDPEGKVEFALGLQG